MSRRRALTQTERAFVDEQRVARLGTVDAEGRPHLVPVCYAFDGEQFYTPLDEKPKRVTDRVLQRVRNIEARPDVALLIDRYDDDWSQLGYLLIRGRARLLDPGAEGHAAALALLRRRYRQYREMSLEERPVIAIALYAVTSWGAAAKT
jgi:PPOX class probable F420-dependent enzyme